MKSKITLRINQRIGGFQSSIQKQIKLGEITKIGKMWEEMQGFRERYIPEMQRNSVLVDNGERKREKMEDQI